MVFIFQMVNVFLYALKDLMDYLSNQFVLVVLNLAIVVLTLHIAFRVRWDIYLS